jgi:hypothetical protein
MRLFSIASVIAIAVTCHTAAHLAPQQPIPSDTLITIRRTVCFGTCPDYTLTIAADGSVIFEGREYVRTKGTAKSTISLETLRQLIGEFDRVKYFSLNDRYESRKDGCPEVWTDNPSAITSIRINGKSKSISHYYGCQAGTGTSIYPKDLTLLETKIDELAGSDRWIK